MSANPMIQLLELVIVGGVFMMMLPWMLQFPSSVEGRLLVSMFGFFFIIGTVLMIFAALSVPRELW